MKDLIQQLRHGITEYLPGPEKGVLIPNVRPPNKLMLHAAGQLESNLGVIQQLSMTNQQLMDHNNQLQELYDQCLESIRKLTQNSQSGTPPQELPTPTESPS